MPTSVAATTIQVAEQGDLGLTQWIWLAIGVMVVAGLVFLASLIVDDAFFGLSSVVVGVIALVAWVGLIAVQSDRERSDLVDRQESALQSEYDFSPIEVAVNGDFVGADSDGMFVSGHLVRIDDTNYYVIFEDQEE